MYKKLYHNNNSSVTDSTKYTNNMQNKQNTESYTQKVNFTIINQNNQQKIHIKTNINDILFENFNKPLKNSHLKYLHLKYLHLKNSHLKYLNLKYPISNTPISNTSISKYRKL